MADRQVNFGLFTGGRSESVDPVATGSSVDPSARLQGSLVDDDVARTEGAMPHEIW